MTSGSPYCDYFGFREDPFNLTPNPVYFCLTREHELAIDELYRGVVERKGVVLMVGEMGTGKTILLKTLQDRVPENIPVSYQLNPSMSFPAIVKKMLKDFGFPLESDSRAELISHCHEKLSELGEEGRYAVLILDESQSLSEEVLEDIRILSNVEDEKGKLLNIILAGQPELSDRISMSSLRSLKHRIGVRIYLKPMGTDEISRYIEHRLEKAGWEGDEQLFSRDAYSWIAFSSNGNPRLINIIADNALHRAYRDRIHRVDKDIVKKTVSALEGREAVGQASSSRSFSFRPSNPFLIAVVVLILVVAVFFTLRRMQRKERRAVRLEQQQLSEQVVGGPETETPSATEEPTVTDTASVGSPVPVIGAEPDSTIGDVMEAVGGMTDTMPEDVSASEAVSESVVFKERSEPVPALPVVEEQAELESLHLASRKPTATPEEEDGEGVKGKLIVVKKDQWFYLILEKEYGRYDRFLYDAVLAANEHIEDPNYLLPGEKLFLPDISEIE